MTTLDLYNNVNTNVKCDNVDININEDVIILAWQQNCDLAVYVVATITMHDTS